jgi:hypothetical protein
VAQHRCGDYDPSETPEGELSRPDRPALARALEGHIKTWVAGVQAQRERIPVGFKETRPERWADPVLYVYALRQLLRGCWAAEELDDSGDVHEAVQAFQSEVPGVIDVRNAFDKFHKEEAAQLGGLAAYATYDDNFTSFTLHVGEERLDIDQATGAGRRMADKVLAVLNTIQ